MDEQQPFLSNRDLILEIREDVRGLREWSVKTDQIIGTAVQIQADDHIRLDRLDSSRLQVRGAWAAITLMVASTAGLAGLALGLLQTV